MKKFDKSSFIYILSAILVLALACTSAYFFNEYRKIKANPQIVVQEKNDTLLKSLSKLMLLPTDETPTVAEVLDKEKLKDQAFFSDSQNGDKIIIYTKAIIYREKDNYIVNVGPILINNSTQASVVLVGSKEGMNTVASKLTSELGTSVTISKKTTSDVSVAKVLVVDIKGNKNDIAKRIADVLSGEVGAIPNGQSVPENTDFVIYTN